VSDSESVDLGQEWPTALYDTLRTADVTHMSYVPDAGHTTLIKLLQQVRHPCFATCSVVSFLASDDASYITGETINPDGGRRVLNYTVSIK